VELRNISLDKLIAAAGGDPWQVNATLQHGRPAQIADLGQAFHNAGQSTKEADNAFAEARRRFQAWNRDNGEHPINESAEVQLATTQLGVQAAQLPKIAVDLENIAAALAEAQGSANAQIAALEARLHTLDDWIGQAEDLIRQDENLLAQPRNDREVIELKADIARLEQYQHDCDREAIDDTRAALQQVNHIRDGYTGALQAAEANLLADGYDPALVRAVDAPLSPKKPEDPGIPIPPPQTSAEDVNKWWNSLSAEDKARLIAAHLPELGNLNGVPVIVRSEVNEAVMNDDLSRVQDVANQRGVSVDEVVANPARYGLTATDITRYNNASQTRKGLDASAKAVDEQGNPAEVFLLKYQPTAFGGDGAAAIAMGNPDKAANTAVLVKGLGSGVSAGTLANPDGVRLYEEAARADWGKDTAVVMWMGYDAPDTVLDPGLYEPNMARTGGQALAADVNALAVTHEGAPSHVTVVGHSYGSTTVSDAAAAYGMHADDVVLVGSPGTDLAHSAADFHLSPSGHLYVGAASGDAVTWSPGHVTMPGTDVALGGLGPDPAADGYGSTRFKAEVPGNSVDPVYDHSHYFDKDSESLFSIADVVSGHGDALQHDGMTAHHRGEYWTPDWVDPEAARPATTGHRHSAPAG
jgi:hypothetical protein